MKVGFLTRSIEHALQTAYLLTPSGDVRRGIWYVEAHVAHGEDPGVTVNIQIADRLAADVFRDLIGGPEVHVEIADPRSSRPHIAVTFRDADGVYIRVVTIANLRVPAPFVDRIERARRNAGERAWALASDAVDTDRAVMTEDMAQVLRTINEAPADVEVTDG